jgi:small subunit ribosomal protein S13
VARITGVNIPENKRVVIALTYIYGIGRTTSSQICKQANIDESTKVSQLDELQINNIREIIEKNFQVEGDLKRLVKSNIKKKMDLKSYQGFRHINGLPVRGQNTHSNARTRKGPAKTIANKKK